MFMLTFWFNSIFTGMSLKRHEYVVDSIDSVSVSMKM